MNAVAKRCSFDELVSMLREQVPAFQNALVDYMDDYEDGLWHLVCHHVVELFECHINQQSASESQSIVERILSIMEYGALNGDEEALNVISVSFVESIYFSRNRTAQQAICAYEKLGAEWVYWENHHQSVPKQPRGFGRRLLTWFRVCD